MKISLFDITGAYLNAEIEEEVCTRISPDATALIQDLELRKYIIIFSGVFAVYIILLWHLPAVAKYIRHDGSIIVRLKKCLYGLRISGTRWYETIATFLITECGYTRSIYITNHIIYA